MTQQDKLYSKEQIEEWASKRADDAGRLSCQLLDTMRENERLKALLYEIGKPIKAQVHPNPSKDSEHGKK